MTKLTSAEIIVISLGTMMQAPIAQQALALAMVGLSMTVGVYGAVALIVKMDDISGLHCSHAESSGTSST